MAYDKIIPVSRRLDHCMDYVLCHEKTDLSAVLNYIGNSDKNSMDGKRLETAINCELQSAYRDMMKTKQRWNKRGGVLGYHLIHSYAPGEVTPQEAHAIGVEFAQRLLGKRYEAVVSTHLDRDHLHCHILFNSVSFVDGRKYQNTFKDYFGDIRETSNEVSRAHGLSVIEPEGKGKHYAEWDAEQKKQPTLRGQLRQDIDKAIAKAFTYQSFLSVLKGMGYAVKQGQNVKYTAVKPPGSPRYIRLSGLGDGYTEEAIKMRLAQGRGGQPVNRPQVQPRRTVHRRYRVRSPLPKAVHWGRGFRALYFRYLYLLHGKPQRHTVPFAIRQEVTRLKQYTEQFYFLREYEIDTAAQLSMMADALQAEADTLTEQRKELYDRRRQREDVTAEIVQINEALRPVRRKLKLCSRIEETVPNMQSQVRLCRENPAQTNQKQKKTERRFHRWK